MIEILTFMAPAICMCIILVGICGYVGIHVVMREVIFIDIALAQIAALGVSFGMFFGLEISDPLIIIVSLTCTLLAAFLLSLTRKLHSKVPQEAFIGILYATGAAAVILTGDRLPHGSEHVHDLMMGHLLWVNWNEVLIYLAVYLILGLLYFLLHTRLLNISQMQKNAKNNDHKLVFWDFIFYALMGILVTFAVRVAGVLLVFGFLIVPAVIGTLLGTSFKSKLIIGWITGLLVSLMGSYLSYSLDFPTGGMVVVTLGLGLFLVAIIKGIRLWLLKVQNDHHIA
ncbi:MAG: metal ABC transporter permease [Calditrichaceae bacterium]|nr:metal ABC transporter permease [Calditrichaceae bacterium]